MDGAVLVSFGPFWDTMIKIFVVLGIFAFAGITFQYLEVEIRSWFGKKEDLSVEYSEDEKTINYDDLYRDEAQDIPDETYEKAVRVMRNAPMSTYNIKEDGTVVNNVTGDLLKPDSTSVVRLDAVSKYPDAYLVQYGELEDFSRRGSTDIRRTFEPREVAMELIEKYDKGYIRWRLAGDENSVPDWHHIGFFTAAFSEDIANHPLPKETVNGNKS